MFAIILIDAQFYIYTDPISTTTEVDLVAM